MIQEVGEYLIEKRVTDQVKLKSNFGQIKSEKKTR